VGRLARAVRHLKREVREVKALAIIIPVAAFALMLRYLIDTTVAKRLKYIVGVIIGASLVVPPAFLPRYTPMFMQLAVGIFITFHLKAIIVDK